MCTCWSARPRGMTCLDWSSCSKGNQLRREPAAGERPRPSVESGVLGDEREPQAPAPSDRVHRRSEQAASLGDDPTLNSPIAGGFPTPRRGPDRALRLSAVSRWAHSLEWVQAQCFTGPTLQSGNNEKGLRGRYRTSRASKRYLVRWTNSREWEHADRSSDRDPDLGSRDRGQHRPAIRLLDPRPG